MRTRADLMRWRTHVAEALYTDAFEHEERYPELLLSEAPQCLSALCR